MIPDQLSNTIQPSKKEHSSSTMGNRIHRPSSSIQPTQQKDEGKWGRSFPRARVSQYKIPTPNDLPAGQSTTAEASKTSLQQSVTTPATRASDGSTLSGQHPPHTATTQLSQSDPLIAFGLRHPFTAFGLRHPLIAFGLRHPLTAFELRHPFIAFGLRHPLIAFKLRHPFTAFGLRHPLIVFGLRHPLTAFGLRHPLIAFELRHPSG
ncbi:hypothetical protein CRG98_013272 [Punica granatum]|uniref:Uncharacterized protein n=1 Tax=Punica granatum TaxID=22663 RepID=A0A2I0KDJ2_PUNGR|nr:hypothetical protein CRG98_013272 [Punica granatum]